MSLAQIVLTTNKTTSNVGDYVRKIGQGERGQVLPVVVTDANGAAYDLTGKSIVFSENKDSGKYVVDDGKDSNSGKFSVTDAKSGKFSYTLQEQVYPESGTAWFDIVSQDGTVLDTTRTFRFKVIPSITLNGNDDNYSSTLQALEAHYQAIILKAENNTQQLINGMNDKINHAISDSQNNLNNKLAVYIRGKTQQINQNTAQIQSNKTNIQSIEAAGKLTYVHVTDQNGDRITDQNNNELIGLKWLITTDKSLTQSDLPADSKVVGDIVDNIADKVSQNSVQAKSNANHIQYVEDAGKFIQVNLVDQSGNYITDQNGVRITFDKWLPMVDKTLTQSDLPADSKAVGDALKFDATKYNIPVLFLYGDRINTLKDKKGSLKNEVKYSFPKYGIQGTCTNFKVQGASSATLPKKNWTLNLDQDVVIFPEYGLQHKYVVKANMSDFTQAKNVVSAKLWGNLRKTHIQNKDTIQDSLSNYLTDQNGNHIVAETDPQLAIGGNIGSVDGFPICIYVNNEYWGLYTFNIPKDDWMAKMPKKQGYAIVDTVWSPQGSFQQETNLKDSMELQFCGTKDNTWVRNSINKLIDACIASYNDTDSFDLAISPYLDLDSAIDYLVFSILINNVDGVFRNFLLQTFNGKKWYFAAYDMDMTFGSKPDDWYSFSLPDYVGSDARKGGATFENFANANRLFHQIWKFHRDQVINEVENAIQSDMSVSVVDNIFTNFDCNIPLPAFLEETKKWAGTPNTGVENLSRIYRWYDQRISWIKQHYLNNK